MVQFHFPLRGLRLDADGVGVCWRGIHEINQHYSVGVIFVRSDGKPSAACNRINYSLSPGMIVWTVFGAKIFAKVIL